MKVIMSKIQRGIFVIFLISLALIFSSCKKISKEGNQNKGMATGMTQNVSGAKTANTVQNGADTSPSKNPSLNALLLDGISKGADLQVVKDLIERGADVNARDSGGSTPLIHASRSANLEFIKYLIENGADVNARDKMGYTPLGNACDLARINGHWELVKLLIQHGATAEDWSSVIGSGNLEIVKLLVEHGAKTRDFDIPQSSVALGMGVKTPLMVAAESGKLDIARYLIEQGSDVNARDSYYTPLIYAILSGNKDVVKYLVETAKADVNALSKENLSPITYAARSDKFNDADCKEVIESLVVNGADVNIKDGVSFYTPLIYAAERGNMEVVKYLVENGAIVKQSDLIDLTALMVASQNGHLNVVRYLLDHNADVNEQNKNHETPIIFAAKNGHLEVVKLLIQKGASDTINNNKETPVILASKNGHLEVVKYLVDNQFMFDEQDQNGFTALMYAAQGGYRDIVQYLVTKANVTLKNIMLQTACDLASGPDASAIRTAMHNCQ